MLGGQLIDFLFAVGLVTHGTSALWLPPQCLQCSTRDQSRTQHVIWVQMTWSEQMSEPRNSFSCSGQCSGTLRAGKCLITSSIRKLILCQKSPTWWQGWWLDVQLDVIHTGSRTTMHGSWAGDNWLKLHHMKKVITRREGYNQEIFWISDITILQASHNYCIP